ncbi:MAG: NAD(P)(+) transhydrogenase (Re/Si-specific) subunit beta, partial [Myxococcaceae bacterium]
MNVRELIIQAIYLASSVLFILGLKSLSRADKARLGMQQAALGMVLAIVGTLFNHEIIRFDLIAVALILGTVIGYPLGMFVPMTAMPQRIAISHMFGALAATLVGIAEYQGHSGPVPRSTMAALGFEVLFGALTVTGSFMAFGKLQEFITGKPVTYRGQNTVNISLFGLAVL